MVFIGAPFMPLCFCSFKSAWCCFPACCFLNAMGGTGGSRNIPPSEDMILQPEGTNGKQMSAPLKVLWHWFAMGPYHFARMSAIAAQPGIELTVVETTSHDDHAWARAAEQLPFRLVTLSAEMLSASTHSKTSDDFARALRERFSQTFWLRAATPNRIPGTWFSIFPRIPADHCAALE